MVKVKGLDFDACFEKAVLFEDGELIIRTIHKNDLVVAKIAAGRPKDLNDLENLT